MNIISTQILVDSCIVARLSDGYNIVIYINNLFGNTLQSFFQPSKKIMHLPKDNLQFARRNQYFLSVKENK